MDIIDKKLQKKWRTCFPQFFTVLSFLWHRSFIIQEGYCFSTPGNYKYTLNGHKLRFLQSPLTLQPLSERIPRLAMVAGRSFRDRFQYPDT